MHRDVASHTLAATLSNLIVDSDSAQNLANVSHVISAAKNSAANQGVDAADEPFLHGTLLVVPRHLPEEAGYSRVVGTGFPKLQNARHSYRGRCVTCHPIRIYR